MTEHTTYESSDFVNTELQNYIIATNIVTELREENFKKNTTPRQV